ncbi:ABC transporter permease [Orrella marina]|uniref:Transport permease protein n=1 Tax=Orrella marina TaxID=2163011 RepID=A0A2R4XFG3_9BURK|nr:ABC transporter permease [Orrella marina]AWB32557.1 sugar ABC transporter permease [Orrella marina]
MKKRPSWKIMVTVVYALVLREVQARIGSHRLGLFWMLFEPMAHIAVLMFVFTYIRLRSIPGMEFPVFLLTGLVPFFMMRNIALGLMGAVDANRALFVYKQITPFDTFIARLIVNFVLMSCVYAILMFVLGFWFGYDISIDRPLYWMWAIFVGITFSFGLGLIFCVVVEAVPELAMIIRLLFLPLYFLSGVIIPSWMLPQRFIEWALWNPYLHVMDSIRIGVFKHYPLTYGIDLNYAVKWAVVTLGLGMLLFKLRERELLAQ